MQNELTGRALASGWLDNCEERKRRAVDELFDVVENSPDPDLKIKAFAALVRAGDADVKREELALKKQALDDARRIRLLELVKHIPAGTLAQIASRHAGDADDYGDSGR